MYSRCACLLAKFAPGSADCTQSGSKGRSARIACRNADRIRTSDIAPGSHSNFPAALRTPRSATPSASPACSAGAGQRCCPAWPQPVSPTSPRASAVHFLNPDIPAAGICDRTKTPPGNASFCAIAASCTRGSFPRPIALLLWLTRNPGCQRNIYRGSEGSHRPSRFEMNCLSHLRVLPSEQKRKRIGGNYGGS